MNKKLMSNFSEWLKSERRKSGKTLMQLKTAIGDMVSDAYLSKLENDKYKGKKGQPTRPDKELVIALADVFRANQDYVLNLAGYPTEIKVLPSELAIMDFDGFDDEDLQDIAEYVAFKRAQKNKGKNNME